MSDLNSNFLYTGLFFLFIFLSGFWLSRRGKPYSALRLTIHKLIGLGAGIFLVNLVYQNHQAAPLGQLEIIAAAAAVLLFLGLVITGGLVSAELTLPDFVKGIHKVLPYLTLLATASSIYLLFT